VSGSCTVLARAACRGIVQSARDVFVRVGRDARIGLPTARHGNPPVWPRAGRSPLAHPPASPPSNKALALSVTGSCAVASITRGRPLRTTRQAVDRSKPFDGAQGVGSSIFVSGFAWRWPMVRGNPGRTFVARSDRGRGRELRVGRAETRGGFPGSVFTANGLDPSRETRGDVYISREGKHSDRTPMAATQNLGGCAG
jgi:hypothetical protein